MIEIYREVFSLLDSYKNTNPEVLNWCSPILYFGNFPQAKIATLGINPSDKEFIDNENLELRTFKRRFHTLNSLNLESWSDIDMDKINIIETSWLNYFDNNPYDIWFKKIDYLMSNTSKSYYFPAYGICHLDLVPFATKSKWGNLKKSLQNNLINDSADILGKMLLNSKIEYIVLNGMSVVNNFKRATEIKFDIYNYSEIDILRKESNTIKGICFEGEIDTFRGINLNKKIKVLGYNHNVQSSFGITNKVLNALRSWISLKIKDEE